MRPSRTKAAPKPDVAAGLAALGFPDSQRESLAALLEKYAAELELYNTAFDLTGAKTREDILVRHIFDSISAVSVIRRLAAQTCAVPPLIGDMGSGPGLPGIPLAAALPEFRFVLVERMAKRTAFLESCAVLLGLSNIRVAQTQAREFPKTSLDICVFRAFKPLDKETASLLLGLLKPQGFLGAYKAKAENIRAEAAAVPFLGQNYRMEKLENPFLPDHERNLFIIPARIVDKKNI